MRGTAKRFGTVGAMLLALGACTRAEERVDAPAAERVARAEVAEEAPPERDLDAERARLAARADSLGDALAGVPGLSRGERADLRRDVNARQVATARSLGIRARAEDRIEDLVAAGRLVPLEDSTELWVVRELDYSVPYVTPDAHRMLTEVGRRFHARLDSLGIPRFRLDVTSVLRTPQNQAALRRRNANAASGVSAHEFGTTVDIAHLRFVAPAGIAGDGDPMRLVEALIMEELARVHASGLQGELGRVLREMRREGKLQVMMERRQAVYHMTVARRIPAQTAAE